MSQFKVVRSSTEDLIESLGNTSQMESIMSALLEIDSGNGGEAGEGGWKEVKKAFEGFGFTFCYDRNLALLTVALFAAIARSKCQTLISGAKFIINICAKNKEGQIVSLGQAFRNGDGYSIYAILNHPTFKKILKAIGISDKYIKKYLDRVKGISPWKRSGSTKVLKVIEKAFEEMTGEKVKWDAGDFPKISNVYTINSTKDFFKLKEIKNKVEYVKVSKGVDWILEKAFSGFDQLKAVELSHGVKNICACAFEGCTALKKIVIPNTVTFIGSESFRECSSLEHIVIPKSVRRFDEKGYTFADCTNLQTVTMECELPGYIGPGMFANCSKLTNVTLPPKIAFIPRDTFKNCSSLTELVIPKAVKTIGMDAFTGCTSLRKVKTSLIGKIVPGKVFPDSPDDIEFSDALLHDDE